MPRPRPKHAAKAALLVLVAACLLIALAPIAQASLAEDQSSGGQPTVETPATDNAPAKRSGLGAKLKRVLWIFLLLSIGGLVLLIGTVLFLLWRAKQLVENAVQPSLPDLEKLVASTRAKHAHLDQKGLAKKLIHRQATRAGLVGFVTGIGGLPTLPIAIPIDLAATLKLQSNLVHMLRMTSGGKVRAEDISQASLWLITTGGQELAVASGTMIRKLVVSALSKSLLKFVPLIGGLVGFAMNWASTQTLGRLTLLWLEGQAGPEAGAVLTPGPLPPS